VRESQAGGEIRRPFFVPLGAKTSVSPAQGLENWRFGFNILLPSVSLLLFKSEGINADLFVFASTALRRGVEIAALSF